MSLLIEDEFNTTKNIEEAIKNNGQYAQLIEWFKRGIKLTPIQANMLLLDYPNFGGRAYGKSYMNMIRRFDYENKSMEIGELLTFNSTHINEISRIIKFQREYYPEFKDVRRNNTSIIFQKVR